MKIIISSGHGLKIRGASGSPVPPQCDEVNEARRVTDRTAAVLRGMGHTVTVFHDDQSTSQSANLNWIVNHHNGAGPHDLDCSIHFNAFDGSAHGCEVLYASSGGQEYAKTIVDRICAASGLTNRGPKKRTDLAFLNGTHETAVLVETAFCDNTNDCNTYKSKFEDICTAIAEGIVGEEAAPGPTPPPVERPPVEVPPPTGAHPEVKKGSTGPAVVELQQKIGVVTADGDFGSITETWVKAFQGSCSPALSTDGVVGPKTWAQVDALQARVDAGEKPLPKQLADQIYTLAQTSEIADYSWPDRGVPPHGYVAGMALCFATAFRRSEAGDVAARTMGQPLGNTDKDALAWYRSELAAKGLTFDTWDARLRALFTLQIGLGPRESSGRYFEGRDMSATNVQSDTCEAGLTQTSWNIRSANPAIGPLLPEFWSNPNGFQDVFREGLSPTASNLNSYGSGDGLRYQWLSRFCPLFHVLVTAVGLRTLRAHWGPIGRKEVTIKSEAHEMLIGVQELLEDAGGV